MRKIIKLPKKKQRTGQDTLHELPSETEEALRVVDEAPAEPAVRLEEQKKERPSAVREGTRRRVTIPPKRAIIQEEEQSEEESSDPKETKEVKKFGFIQRKKTATRGSTGRKVVIPPKRALIREDEVETEEESPARKSSKFGFFKKGWFFQREKKNLTDEPFAGEEAGDEDEGGKRSKKRFFQRGLSIRLPGKKKQTKVEEAPPLIVHDEPEVDQEVQGDEESAVPVAKLTPGTHRGDARSRQPHVAELLENEEELKNAEDDWGAIRTGVPIGWFFLVGLLVCGAGGWAVYDVFRAQPVIEEVSIEKEELVKEREREDKEVKQSLEKMEDCVEAYFGAANMYELLPLVRFPDRVRPLMEDYYRKNGRRKTTFHYFEGIWPIPYGRKSFVHVKVALKEGGYYHLFLEELADGTFRVDWESDVYYQPMAWGEYVSKRPMKPMDMRVRVAPDHFYGFAFRDQEKYQCYRLTALGSDRFLFGYVERGTELARKLESVMVDVSLIPDPEAEEEPAEMGKREEENDEEVKGENDEEGLLLQPKKDPLEIQHRLKMDQKKHKQVKGKAMILRLRFLLEDDSTQCVKIEELLSEQWAYYDLPEAEADGE